jgi:hypothetical protein
MCTLSSGEGRSTAWEILKTTDGKDILVSRGFKCNSVKLWKNHPSSPIYEPSFVSSRIFGVKTEGNILRGLNFPRSRFLNVCTFAAQEDRRSAGGNISLLPTCSPLITRLRFHSLPSYSSLPRYAAYCILLWANEIRTLFMIDKKLIK